MMPAVRATPSTSPLAISPARMALSVAGRIFRTTRATASLAVSFFAETSTIRASPEGVRWEKPRKPGASLDDGMDLGAGPPASGVRGVARVPDHGLHPVLAHELELLQLAHAPLLVQREKPANVELLEFLLVFRVVFLEPAELGVLSSEALDYRFQIGHRDLLCAEVAAVTPSYTPALFSLSRLPALKRWGAVALNWTVTLTPSSRPNSPTARCVTSAVRGKPQSTRTRTCSPTGSTRATVPWRRLGGSAAPGGGEPVLSVTSSARRQRRNCSPGTASCATSMRWPPASMTETPPSEESTRHSIIVSMPTKRATTSDTGARKTRDVVSSWTSRPSISTPTRSARTIASSWSWVTRMVVMRSSRRMRPRSPISASRVGWSSAEKGSSRSRRSG